MGTGNPDEGCVQRQTENCWLLGTRAATFPVLVEEPQSIPSNLPAGSHPSAKPHQNPGSSPAVAKALLSPVRDAFEAVTRPSESNAFLYVVLDNALITTHQHYYPSHKYATDRTINGSLAGTKGKAGL